VTQICILLVAANQEDVETIQQCLDNSELVFKLDWVSDRNHFLSALKHGKYDLILAEYNLAALKGVDTLHLVKQGLEQVPCIFVSDLEAEAVEVEALRAGAADFILKRRLARLPIAIDRALANQRNICVYKQSQGLHRATKADCIFDQAVVGIAYTDLQGNILRVNPKLCEILGYSAGELLKKNFKDITHPADVNFNTFDANRCIGKVNSLGSGFTLQKRYLRRDGSELWASLTVSMISNELGESYAIGFVEDISDRKQAETKLQQSQRFLTNVLETAFDGIMAFRSIRNSQGQIVDFEWIEVNPAAASLTNRTPEQLLGKRLLEEMPGNEEEGLFDQYVRVVETGATFEHEFYYDHENIQAWFHNISVKQGDGFVVTFRNITSQKEMEEELRKIKDDLERRIQRRTAELNIANRLLHDEVVERERIEEILIQSESHLRLALNAANMGTWEWDVMNDQMSYSPQAEVILGLEPNSFAGSCLASLELIHPEDRDMAYKKKREAIETGIPYEVEERILKPDGTIRWIAVQGDVVFGSKGEPVRMIGVIADITDRKQAEVKVLRTLEKERELNELKSRFVNMVSHEFRNPLAVIFSAAETLERYADRLSADRRQKRIQNIKSSCDYMNSLLEDVLVIGRAESGMLMFEPKCINLETFCHDLIEMMRMAQMSGSAASSVNNIELIYLSEYEVAQLDAKLLHHILLNLLSNAVKYSPQGDKIEFRVDCAAEQVIFTIKDSGIGIPSSDIPRLFEPFHRAKNAKDIAGTGLGLSIVKRALDLHGGHIAVVSKEQQGTTFTVTIPTANCQPRY
jgi:PAS domain S-box-containing protein